MEENGKFAENLRSVFEYLPRDNLDRVKLSDFLELMKDHINIADTEAIETMVQQFNVDNEGYMTYNEFCNGVRKMTNMNCLPLLTGRPVDTCSQEGDECRVPSDASTFNEYDIFTDDDQTEINAAALYSDTFSLSASDSIINPANNPFHEEYVRELSDKVVLLEKQMESLTETYKSSDDTANKLKEENSALMQRIRNLEYMLEDLDDQARLKMEDELKKRESTLKRLEIEKTSEVDLLTERLQLAEKEYEKLSGELPLLKKENKRLTTEMNSLDHELKNLKAESEQTAEMNLKLKNELDALRQETISQVSIKQQLVEELTRELDDLRHQHNDRSQLVDKSSRRHELEQQLVILKEQNAHLREKNEDLEDQFNCLTSGRSLWVIGNISQTLAQEIDGLSKDELITALHDQRRINESLKDYIDKLTLRVLEVNPTLLEVSQNHGRHR